MKENISLQAVQEEERSNEHEAILLAKEALNKFEKEIDKNFEKEIALEDFFQNAGFEIMEVLGKKAFLSALEESWGKKGEKGTSGEYLYDLIRRLRPHEEQRKVLYEKLQEKFLSDVADMDAEGNTYLLNLPGNQARKRYLIEKFKKEDGIGSGPVISLKGGRNEKMYDAQGWRSIADLLEENKKPIELGEEIDQDRKLILREHLPLLQDAHEKLLDALVDIRKQIRKNHREEELDLLRDFDKLPNPDDLVDPENKKRMREMIEDLQNRFEQIEEKEEKEFQKRGGVISDLMLKIRKALLRRGERQHL